MNGTWNLGSRPEVNHVLIFENKGTLVGTSNPHPHCQIYASSMLYGITESEVVSSRQYFRKTGQLLGQAIWNEKPKVLGVISQNRHFLACVPWFARYAYEVIFCRSSQPLHLVTWMRSGGEASLNR